MKIKDINLPDIFDYVADGGSLTTWCRTNKLKYSAVISHLNSDPSYKQRYAEALAARDEWGREAIMAEIRLIALTDLREVFDTNGSLLPKDQWPEGIARAISSVEVDELYMGTGEARRLIGYTKKIKLWDKQKALESAGKALGILAEVSEVKGDVTHTHRVEAIDLDERIAQFLAPGRN